MRKQALYSFSHNKESMTFSLKNRLPKAFKNPEKKPIDFEKITKTAKPHFVHSAPFTKRDT